MILNKSGDRISIKSILLTILKRYQNYKNSEKYPGRNIPREEKKKLTKKQISRDPRPTDADKLLLGRKNYVHKKYKLSSYKNLFINKKDNNDLHIEGSAGNGKWAGVPWIRIYDKKWSPSATKGLYLVYLFATNNDNDRKVYLSLNMGVTNLQQHKFNIDEFCLITRYYYNLLKDNDLLRSKRFTKNDITIGPINLNLNPNDDNKTPRGYEYGNIISIRYSENYLRNNNKNIDRQLKEDLNNMISLYNWLKYNKSQRLKLLQNNDNPSKNNNFGSHNIIYYGAPGVGKSFKINKLIHNGPNVFRTTFYPDYDYTDFVGQVMPNVNGVDKGVTFKFEPGPFSKALEFAYHYPDIPTYLVIEEISRANASAVFGDIFQLLDLYPDSANKRDKRAGTSEYPIINNQIGNWLGSKYGLVGDIKNENNKLKLNKKEKEENRKVLIKTQNKWGENKSNKIFLPSNFHIYATANLDDQNVHPMDSAFQRRFSWHYISTDFHNIEKNKDNQYPNNPKFYIDGNSTSWFKLYTTLNKYINSKNEDKQIGPFFINFRNSNNDTNKKYNKLQIQDKLLRYLWSNFGDQSLLISNNKKIFNAKINSFEKLSSEFKNAFSYKKGTVSNKIFDTDFDESLNNKNSSVKGTKD